MSATLFLDKRGLALSLDGKALVIHQDGKYLRSLSLNMIDRLVCRSSVEIKTSVLAQLAENNIGMSFFGGRQGSRQVHIGVNGTRDVNRRILQYEVFCDPQVRLAWSVRLIQFKLMRQENLLRRMLRRRPECRYVLLGAINNIARMRVGLEEEPVAATETLLGIEGAAAREYFAAIAALLPDSIGFKSRNRRPPRDPANALLSLGYTLLHGQMVQALASAGLDTALGVYHRPAFGRDSLAVDLSELYRCEVDRLVLMLFARRALQSDHFSSDGDACLLSKEGRAIFYPAYQKYLGGLAKRARRLVLKVIKTLEK